MIRIRKLSLKLGDLALDGLLPLQFLLLSASCRLHLLKRLRFPTRKGGGVCRVAVQEGGVASEPSSRVGGRVIYAC
jgi:hypothetical protein